jgi:hypothetical protein
MANFYQMIRWMRPANTPALDMFCELYLEPVFGKPDAHNNYIKIINNPDGSAPNLCFTAHSDTVHQDGGIQDIVAEGNLLYSVGDDCLGADCTTGIWLILEMIREKIPGVYVIHDSEEVGCKGSRALVRDCPDWLLGIDAVISFDRKGKESVVTHQIGTRTASDAFAKSFALALDMPELKPDSGGVYTDSNEYIDIVSECTNISVGYFAQHTKQECQDVEFMVHLRNKLIKADWSKLVFERDPNEKDFGDYGWGRGSKFDSRFDSGDYERDSMLSLVEHYPEDIADYLYNLGFTSDDIATELGIGSNNSYLSRFFDHQERKVG